MKRKKASSKAGPPVDPNLKIIVRAKIREVLSALPKGREATGGMILDGLKAFGYEVDGDTLREAMEWNHERNYIDYIHNYNADRDEWFLTERGRNQL